MSVTTTDGLDQRFATVCTERDAAAAQVAQLQSECAECQAAQATALDNGDISKARDHGTAAASAALALDQATADLGALTAAAQRLSEQLATRDTEDRLRQARDVYAAAVLQMRDGVRQVADTAAQLATQVRQLAATQEATRSDARNVAALEVALGLREFTNYVSSPNDGEAFLQDNPQIAHFASLLVRR